MTTPLHTIGDFLRELLLQIPLPVARGLFLALPILLLIWVLCLPREVTTPPDGSKRWDENLKVGAVAALAAQILIYSLV